MAQYVFNVRLVSLSEIFQIIDDGKLLNTKSSLIDKVHGGLGNRFTHIYFKVDIALRQSYLFPNI